MIKRLTQAAMITSWLFFSYLLLSPWIGQTISLDNNLWGMFDLPPVPEKPPVWLIGLGCFVSAFMLSCLTMAYVSVWRILEGGTNQDFRIMDKRMRLLAYGLIGFWIGWNTITGGILALLIYFHPCNNIPFEYQFFDLDILFPIVAMAIIAISRTMERAWAAEDEN